MFTEHQHLLLAALSSLKAAKGVLNSMSEDKTLGKYKSLPMANLPKVYSTAVIHNVRDDSKKKKL